MLNYTCCNVVQELGCVPSSLGMAMASASGCTGGAGVHIPLPRAGGTMSDCEGQADGGGEE